MTYIIYQENYYKLEKGPNGGKYINFNGKKVYIDKKRLRKLIVKKNKKHNSKNIINNLEVVILNDTKLVRKILKKVKIKNGKYLLPNNYFSKDYYERITGFKWDSLDWE